MRGIILCGGMGTRLQPLTNVINKHLLPVWDRPMIYYPIQSMVNSGITDILLVCGGPMAGDFLRIIGNGEEFGLKHVAYTYQKTAGGIADALSLAEHWSKGEPVCVMLGDNVLQKDFSKSVSDFESNPEGAAIFTTRVAHPQWYGVVEKDVEGKVVQIVEKPEKPSTDEIAIGLYMYDEMVWQYIKTLKPSKRNELEVTDLNNAYLKEGKLKAYEIDGWWGDLGESIETYFENSTKVKELFSGA